MVKIIHSGDLHYAPNTLEEVDRCMQVLVDQAAQPDVDCVVIGGDSTDHLLNAHAPAFLALTRRVQQLSANKPMLMLQGTFSHEPVGMLRVFGTLCDNVYVAEKIGQVALTQSGKWIASEAYRFTEAEYAEKSATEPWRAVFTCLPVVNKATLIANVGAADQAQELGDLIAALLVGWFPINAFFAQNGIATIGVSHGTVRESKTEHGVPMHGTDHEYTTGALFSAGCSAFLLNHIHLHQSWEVNGRRIAYSGSLPCLHHGEIGKKGFLRWSVAPETADFEFIESPAQQFSEFNFSGAPDIVVLRLADVTGKKVRVRYVVNIEDRASVNDAEIHAALACAVSVTIEPRILAVSRTRAEGLSVAATHRDRLTAWAAQTNVEPDSLTALYGALDELGGKSAAEIAAALMQRVTQPDALI